MEEPSSVGPQTHLMSFSDRHQYLLELHSSAGPVSCSWRQEVVDPFRLHRRNMDERARMRLMKTLDIAPALVEPPLHGTVMQQNVYIRPLTQRYIALLPGQEPILDRIFQWLEEAEAVFEDNRRFASQCARLRCLDPEIVHLDFYGGEVSGDTTVDSNLSSMGSTSSSSQEIDSRAAEEAAASLRRAEALEQQGMQPNVQTSPNAACRQKLRYLTSLDILPESVRIQRNLDLAASIRQRERDRIRRKKIFLKADIFKVPTQLLEDCFGEGCGKRTPEEKLQILVQCAQALVFFMEGLGWVKVIGADDLMPCLVWTVVQAQAKCNDLFSQLACIREFVSSDALYGEADYYFSCMEVAVCHIMNVDLEPLEQADLRLKEACSRPQES